MTADKALLTVLLVSLILGIPLVMVALYRIYKTVK